MLILLHPAFYVAYNISCCFLTCIRFFLNIPISMISCPCVKDTIQVYNNSLLCARTSHNIFLMNLDLK